MTLALMVIAVNSVCHNITRNGIHKMHFRRALRLHSRNACRNNATVQHLHSIVPSILYRFFSLYRDYHLLSFFFILAYIITAD